MSMEEPTMLERVAEAVRLHASGNWTPEGMARTAIEAMREPTPEMSASVTNILSHFDGEFGDYNVYFKERQGDEIWQAMIDAALTEPAPSRQQSLRDQDAPAA